jgi:hypothetical protein
MTNLASSIFCSEYKGLQVGKLQANTPVNSELALPKPKDQFSKKSLFWSDALMFSIDSCLMVPYCTC